MDGRNRYLDVPIITNGDLYLAEQAVPISLAQSTHYDVAGGSAGTKFGCVVVSTGAVKCFGDNESGQLGLGDAVDHGDGDVTELVNQPFLSVGPAVSVAAGGHHACVMLASGRVKCWGNNSSGQLGLGDTEHRGDQPNEMGYPLPTVDLGEYVLATDIACGGAHSCAILESGAVKCWGDNSSGQLGLEDTENRGDEEGEMGDALPEVDLGSVVVTKLVLGEVHSCALLSEGAVKCWGETSGAGSSVNHGDAPGTMGDNLPVVDFGEPVVVQDLAAKAHTCALLAGGAVRCWGVNAGGRVKVFALGDEPGEMGDALPVVMLE
jgi:alpha-tubulin suppressor-like RCC1 family protein